MTRNGATSPKVKLTNLNYKDAEKILAYYAPGEITGQSFLKIFELTEFLLSIIEFPEEISDYDRRIIIGRVRAKASSTIPSLLKIIQYEVDGFLRRESSQYIILVPIGMPLGLKITQRVVEGLLIKNGASRKEPVNRRILDSAEELFNKHELERPPFQHYMRVFVVAKSEAEAFRRAEYSFRLLRSIWTLLGAGHQFSRSLMSSRAAIGPITLGPLFTIHTKDGAAVSSKLTFSEGLFEPIRLLKISRSHWSTVLSRDVKMLKVIQSLKYQKLFKDLLITYGDALDLGDHNSSVLHLWGLLERLSGGDRRTSGDVTVARVASLYQATPESHIRNLQILNCCRLFRNAWAHSALSDQRTWWVAMRLKLYVDYLFTWHLDYGARFDSLEEIGDYLDLQRKYKNKDLIKNWVKLTRYVKSPK